MKVNKGTGVQELGVRDVGDTNGREPQAEDPKLDRAIQARIGDQLRAMYTELMEQPVPDRFRDLLEKLDQENKEKSR
jgi:hypothetical protein